MGSKIIGGGPASPLPTRALFPTPHRPPKIATPWTLHLVMAHLRKKTPKPVLCRWHIYGCKHRYTADRNHEEICSLRPRNPGGEPLWRELFERLHQDPVPKLDIMAALGPWARDIKAVQFLPPGQTPIQDIPYYVDVSSWWSRGIPKKQTLEDAMLPSLKRRLGADCCRRLMEQMEPESKHLPAEALRVLNHQAPRYILRKLGLQVPQWVPLAMEQCLWNVTPKHAYTDLHTDRGLDTVTFQVGGRKIWILYEPDPPVSMTNKVLERQSRFFLQWAQHFDDAYRGLDDAAMDEKTGTVLDEKMSTFLGTAGPKLRRPFIAVTEGQQGLFVPAGWKHAVFTLEGGYLAGYSFCTHEHVEQHVNTLICELQASMAFRNSTEYSAKTDHLLPDLWEDLNQSLSYVLLHMIQIWESNVRDSKAVVDELWIKLGDFLENGLPEMKDKNRAAIKKCIKLAKQGESCAGDCRDRR
jgi:hypothetical protein